MNLATAPGNSWRARCWVMRTATVPSASTISESSVVVASPSARRASQ